MGTPREHVVMGTSILGLTTMIIFTTFVAAAVVNVRRPEWHKRFMVLATFAILQAVVARYVLLVPDLIQPHRALATMVLGDLLLLIVILFDARMYGRFHPAYMVGGAFLVLVQVVRSPVTHTPFWRDACLWLASLAGQA
jgi:hypothetical protein